jgi:hypothetical protein
VCSFLEHHASVAARGALRVLLNEHEHADGTRFGKYNEAPKAPER